MRSEPRGFTDFVVARSPSLLRYGWLLTANWASAEDLLQSALASVWPRWEGIGEAGVESYIRTTMTRTYITWWRRRSWGEIAVAAPHDTTVADGADVVAMRCDVVVALGRLPRRQRAVVVLRYYLDLGEAEVARELGCSVGTVKSQAAKGVAHLRADPDMRNLLALPTVDGRRS
jgi:RNA polymerase sigma-70 factor (sigma-E family)